MSDIDQPAGRFADGEPTTQRVSETTTTAGRVGRYRLRRIIASGGMGIVYEAIQENPRRIVALKVMRHGATSRAALRRFEHESAILARLRHPGIAQVFEAGTHDDGLGSSPYFAMEYIPRARSITEYAVVNDLGVRERLQLFARVCDAVQHGHEHGIIHRDLKPDNILIDPNGDPKVIDFGVARTTDHDLAVTTLHTEAGELVGTLQYMSPEQVDADPRGIDERTDVYALGVVLYELLTNSLPYSVAHLPLDEAIRTIREEPALPLSASGSHVQRALQTIVQTALHKDRNRRYATAAELAADVRRSIAGEPLAARRDSAVYMLGLRTSRAVARHPVATGIFVVAFVTALVELIGVPIVFRMTPVNRAFVGAMADLGSWRAWPAELEDVRIVRITDQTLARAAELASAHGLQWVSGNNPISLRRLHKPFMERLAGSGARVLLYDAAFRIGPTMFDTNFTDGVEALEMAGVDVIVNVFEWPLGVDEQPAIVSTIRPEVRWGGSTGGWDASSFWSLHVAAQRPPGPLMPSATTDAFAAAHHPGAGVELDLVDNGRTLQLGFLAPPDAGGHRAVIGAPEYIPLTRLDYESYREQVDGLAAGDTVAWFWYELPPDEVLEASTIDYEWVLQDATDDELRERLDGTIVVVGNFMSTNPPHAAPGGREVHATHGYASALQQMLDGDPVRVETRGVAFGLLLAASVVGVFVAALRRLGVLWLAATLVVALAVIGAVSTTSFLTVRYLIDPTVPAVGLILSFLVMLGLMRIRANQV